MNIKEKPLDCRAELWKEIGNHRKATDFQAIAHARKEIDGWLDIIIDRAASGSWDRAHTDALDSTAIIAHAEKLDSLMAVSGGDLSKNRHEAEPAIKCIVERAQRILDRAEAGKAAKGGEA